MKKIGLIPDNLDIEAITFKAAQEIPAFSLVKLLGIVNLIYLQWGYSSWEIQEGYVQIHSSRFNEVADDYPNYLKYLILAGIILCDETYRPQRDFPGNPKSKGYKFNEPYSEAFPKAISISENSLGRRRRTIQRSSKRDIQLKAYEERLKLYPFISNLDDLSFDFDGAFQCLDKICRRLNESRISGEELKTSIHRMSRCYATITQFEVLPARKTIIDKAGFRLHSPLTRLKKEFRYFLKYKGEHLVSLDLKNSQPFFSLALMTPEFWHPETIQQVDGSTKKGRSILSRKSPFNFYQDSNNYKNRIPSNLKIGNLYPEFANFVWRLSNSMPEIDDPDNTTSVADNAHTMHWEKPEAITEPSTLETSGQRDRRRGPDCETILSGILSQVFVKERDTQFRKAVLNGTLYEELAIKLEQLIKDDSRNESVLEGAKIAWKDNDPDIKRSAAKALMVRAMYGSNFSQKLETKLAFEMLEACYPQIHNFFWYLRKGGHKVLARLLQRIESFIVLKACARAIKKANSKIPLWTIHDCFVTIEKHREQVGQIVAETIERYIGEKPVLKVEFWSEYRPESVTFTDQDIIELPEVDEPAQYD